MFFFYLEKNYIFWFFLFNKKFIITYENVEKTNNLNFKNKLFLIKSQKNKYHLNLNYDFSITGLTIIVGFWPFSNSPISLGFDSSQGLKRTHGTYYIRNFLLFIFYKKFIKIYINMLNKKYIY